jgi:formylglycine-generating enzyme required for sulfatase activity
MKLTLSLKGIDQALENLPYRNPNTPKYRLMLAIRQHFKSEEDLSRIQEIPMDALIPGIWETGEDIQIIRSRRKNFASLRTAINTDLKEMMEQGLNPEGVIISKNNTFEMADLMREKLLQTVSGMVSGEGGQMAISRLYELLGLVKTFLDRMEKGLDDPEGKELQELKRLLEGLGNPSEEKAPEENPEKTAEEGDGKDEDLETLEMGEDEELVEVDDTDGDTETIEMDEDEELVEVDDTDGDTETIEMGEDEELVEVDDTDGDTETIEMDEDEELVEVDGADEEMTSDPLDPDSEASEGALVELAEDEELVDAEEDLAEMDEENEEPVLDLVEDEDVEEVEVDGELDPDLFEELVEPEPQEESEEEPQAPELGLPFGSDEDFSEYDPEDMQKNRLLSERFDGYLGAMERFYNQYPLIEGRSFTVGSPNPGKLERREQELILKDFYIGRFPVTNALFEVFIERTGYRTTAEKTGYGTVFQPRFRKVKNPVTGEIKALWQAETASKRIEGAAWFAPEGPGSNIHGKRNHPVVQVSLEDARRFAAWIGKRLPSEDEWEAAARTPKALPYPWGETWEAEAANVEATGMGETTAVDTFTKGKNAYSLMDLVGNVLEWTQTPMEGISPKGSHLPFFVAKGGSFITAGEPRLWTRYPLRPDFTANILGFRCLVD